MTLSSLSYDSPLGTLLITSKDDYLVSISSAEFASASYPLTSSAVADETARQLDEYFALHRRAFTLPLAPASSPFVASVRAALASVSYATTITYAVLAARISSPRATRAVARALSTNPLLVVVPCHRIVAAKDQGDYALGREAKHFLLDLELRALTLTSV